MILARNSPNLETKVETEHDSPLTTRKDMRLVMMSGMESMAVWERSSTMGGASMAKTSNRAKFASTFW